MSRSSSRRRKRTEHLFHGEAQGFIQRARSLWRSGDDAGAMEYYRQALSMEPQNPRALQGLADIHYHRKSFKEAASLFEACLAVSPPTEYALYALGGSYRALNRERLAMRTYERILELNPCNTRALTRLADLFLKRGSFREAADCCRRVLELEPGNVFALGDLGNACRGTKDYRGAMEAFGALVKLRPTDHRSLTRLGDVYLKLGRDREAEQCYRKALSLVNDYPYAMRGLDRMGLPPRAPSASNPG